jgi:hypothetical protein
MSSRWFVVPGTNIPENALAQMVSDPIAVLEHILEPQTIAPTESREANERGAPTHLNAATIPLEPFASRSTAANNVLTSLPRRFSAPKIVAHKIRIPPTPQTDNPRLAPFHSVQTAKAGLRPVKSHATTVTAAAGEFNALSQTVAETPNSGELSALSEPVTDAPDFSHQDLTSSSPAVKSITRMISGAPALTSLLGENIGNKSIPEQPSAAVTRSWNAELPSSLEVPSSSRTATQAASASRREATRSAGTAFENLQQSQTRILATAQHHEPTASPESPQTLSAAVN